MWTVTTYNLLVNTVINSDIVTVDFQFPNSKHSNWMFPSVCQCSTCCAVLRSRLNFISHGFQSFFGRTFVSSAEQTTSIPYSFLFIHVKLNKAYSLTKVHSCMHYFASCCSVLIDWVVVSAPQNSIILVQLAFASCFDKCAPPKNINCFMKLI